MTPEPDRRLTGQRDDIRTGILVYRRGFGPRSSAG
jgi:hypothetical protein